MEPNQDNKAGQPVDNKASQPIVPPVKKEETTPTASPAKQEEKVQPLEPTATDDKKISDTPDTKEPEQDDVKGKAGVSAPPAEKTV